MDFCHCCGAYFSTIRQPGLSTEPFPSDPLECGLSLLNTGRFLEGVTSLKDAISTGREVDGVLYGRITDSITSCMLGVAIQHEEYRRAGMVQIARVISGRELLSDIMSRLAGSLGVCTIQNGVLGLANCYMHLFVDTFFLYTNIRDMQRVCSAANDALGAMINRMIGFVDALYAKGPEPLERINSYNAFTERILDTVLDIVESTPSDRLDRVAAEWASTEKRTYAGLVENVFFLSTHSTAGGAVSSRLLKHISGTYLKGFEKVYLAGPRS